MQQALLYQSRTRVLALSWHLLGIFWALSTRWRESPSAVRQQAHAWAGFSSLALTVCWDGQGPGEDKIDVADILSMDDKVWVKVGLTPNLCPPPRLFTASSTFL